MAENKDKKDSKKVTSEPTPVALVTTLVDMAAILMPDIPEGTLLRIVVPITPRREEDTDHLTYAAIFVNNRWYLTGQGNGPLSREYQTTVELFKQIGVHQGATIEAASTFDSIR